MGERGRGAVTVPNSNAEGENIRINVICIIIYRNRIVEDSVGDSSITFLTTIVAMAAARMSRRCRKFLRRIQRTKITYQLQEIASEVQAELERRNLSYDEALNLGNQIHVQGDSLPEAGIIYAISDRDAYRRTLELYLKDSILTKTEQLLLWEERRRLGISQEVHDNLLEQLLKLWERQGKNVTVHRWKKPGKGAEGGGASES